MREVSIKAEKIINRGLDALGELSPLDRLIKKCEADIELLSHHIPSMDEESLSRARNTIAYLESEIETARMLRDAY